MFLSLSVFVFIGSQPFFIHLPEQHNRKKEKHPLISYRPFSSCLEPLSQSEAKCESIDIEMIFLEILIFLFLSKCDVCSDERFCTQPRFENESLWNSKKAYYYQKTSLEQVFAQNSSCRFIIFMCFFVLSILTRNKDWNKSLAAKYMQLYKK